MRPSKHATATLSTVGHEEEGMQEKNESLLGAEERAGAKLREESAIHVRLGLIEAVESASVVNLWGSGRLSPR